MGRKLTVTGTLTDALAVAAKLSNSGSATVIIPDGTYDARTFRNKVLDFKIRLNSSRQGTTACAGDRAA